MWGIALKGVIAHRLRYALTTLAVLLGVAFIAGTFVLTDTMNSTFNGLYDQIYSGTAAVVRATQSFNPGVSFTDQRQLIDASLAGDVARVPGVKAVALDIGGYAQLVGKDGKPIGVASNGPPTLGVAWTDVTAVNPLRLLPGGQPPRGPGEVVIDKHSADVGPSQSATRCASSPRRAPPCTRSPASPRGAASTARSARPSRRSIRRRPPGCSASPARSTSSTCKPSPGCRRTPW